MVVLVAVTSGCVGVRCSLWAIGRAGPGRVKSIGPGLNGFFDVLGTAKSCPPQNLLHAPFREGRPAPSTCIAPPSSSLLPLLHSASLNELASPCTLSGNDRFLRTSRAACVAPIRLLADFPFPVHTLRCSWTSIGPYLRFRQSSSFQRPFAQNFNRRQSIPATRRCSRRTIFCSTAFTLSDHRRHRYRSTHPCRL